MRFFVPLLAIGAGLMVGGAIWYKLALCLEEMHKLYSAVRELNDDFNELEMSLRDGEEVISIEAVLDKECECPDFIPVSKMRGEGEEH